MAVCAALAATMATSVSPRDETPRAAPPFPTRDAAAWIGTPVTWHELSGRVVLLDVWTFG